MSHVIDAIITLKDQFSAVLDNVNTNVGKFSRQQIAVGKQIEKTGKSLEKTGATWYYVKKKYKLNMNFL